MRGLCAGAPDSLTASLTRHNRKVIPENLLAATVAQSKAAIALPNEGSHLKEQTRPIVNAILTCYSPLHRSRQKEIISEEVVNIAFSLTKGKSSPVFPIRSSHTSSDDWPLYPAEQGDEMRRWIQWKRESHLFWNTRIVC